MSDGWEEDERDEEFEGLVEDAHLCGCGMPEEAALTVLRLMQPNVDYPSILAQPETGDAGVDYLLTYWMSEFGWTEHGGSVPGWLTEEGKELKPLLELWAQRYQSTRDANIAPVAAQEARGGE